MQKKLALACTLVHSPEVIFLDEPTTGVDPISRREFWDILAGLHVRGVTLFVSTPYMDEAERCSRVGLMYAGQIIECDTPDALRKLVPGELLAVWTPHLARAREVVRGLPGVREVQTYGDVLHVFVDDAGCRAAAIEKTLTEAEIVVRELRRTSPRMEEAFISLMHRQEHQSAI
jgi:ABC-2 type transport system ATP-binding protein